MSGFANVALWRDFGIATAVVTAYLLLIKVLGGKAGDPDLQGSPTYSWWVSLSIQVFWFPLMCYIAFLEISPGQSFISKLHEQWPAGAREEVWPWVRVWMGLFFGYMTKDMVGVYPIGAMYLVHHIVCLFLVTSFTMLDLPPAMMIAGGTFGEIGSAAINSYEMGYAMGKDVLRHLVAVVMTMSNVGVMWLLYQYGLATDGAMKYAIIIVTCGLLTERERQVLITTSAKETLIPAGKGKPARLERGNPTPISGTFSIIGTVTSSVIILYLATVNSRA